MTRVHIAAPCLAEVGYVHVDDNFIVIDKPPGLLSIPGRYVRDSVLHRVFFEYADVRVVHRLDMQTSGLMVLARSVPAARELSRQFRHRQVRKEYIARIWGDPAEDAGVIDAPLGRDPDHKPRHRVDPVHGKVAITSYEVMARSGESARVRLRPVTGRSHQLRVHLAHLGHPILGCDLYAHDAARQAAGRLQLHASRLEFTHPKTGEALAFESAPPF